MESATDNIILTVLSTGNKNVWNSNKGGKSS